MDTIPDREFIHIFNRTARYIDVKGAYDPRELDDRMRKIQKAMLIRKHKSKTDAEKWKYHRKQKNIKKLRDHGFSRRVIEEAIADPYGKIALTLKHGFKKAEDILLKRRR